MIPIAKPLITQDEMAAVAEVLAQGQLASGKWVTDFEEKFAAYIGCSYGIATSSGTTGLHIALEAAGIGLGDKVLTTPFSFIASSNAILYCGAVPVFGDIDPVTFNLTPESIERALKKDPTIKGLLIVHLYGLPCNMEKIMELVNNYKLVLVEDCAQAHGAEYKGQKVGSFGHCGVFSFYGTKNMITGEGGMVLTNDPQIANNCRILINHGSEIKYHHQQLGYNYRMTNVEAAIGLVQLNKLDAFNQKRRENARYLSENLQELAWLTLPTEPEGYKHVYHQYTLQMDNRDAFVVYLQEKGIGFGIHYSVTIPSQQLYRTLKQISSTEALNAEEIAKKVISIPVHPGLSQEDLEQIISTIRAYSE